MSSLAVQVAICLFILCISTLSVTIPSQNVTAQMLWKLYHFALQSRITHPYPYPYKYPGKYPEYYQNYPYPQYPGSTYAPFYNKNPYPYDLHNHVTRPNGFGTYSDILQHFPKPKESLINILHSIASNDDLQCVPKLICEVTSGTISVRQQGLNLPVNVNMESLLGFLSSLNGVQSSPLLYFAKAALLGLAARRSTGTCNYAYPQCPVEPDKIVKYLNNHNGGFFRFFSQEGGSSNTQIYQPLPQWTKRFAEQRIQNNAGNNFKYQQGITFPAEENVALAPQHPHSYRFGKVLKFPNNDVVLNDEPDQNTDLYSAYIDFKFPNDDNYEHSVRNPKEFDHNYFNAGTDFQKPLPNHQASPLIYPVRTGTGDLRLDPEELQEFKKPIYYQDDDVRVVFNEINNDDTGYVKKGKDFSFPQ